MIGRKKADEPKCALAQPPPLRRSVLSPTRGQAKRAPQADSALAAGLAEQLHARIGVVPAIPAQQLDQVGCSRLLRIESSKRLTSPQTYEEETFRAGWQIFWQQHFMTATETEKFIERDDFGACQCTQNLKIKTDSCCSTLHSGITP